MLATREKVEQVKQARYESYQAYEFERLKTDEITDQAERLRAPMNHSFEYELKDGRLSFQGQFLDEILDDGLKKAEIAAASNPNWKFEFERRKIEREELGQIEVFARGELEAEALAVLSPIPDAVRYDGVDIGGYNKERNKMLARVVTKTDKGVSIRPFSLDQSNYQGIQAIAKTLDSSLEDGLSSEEILQKRFLIKTPVDSSLQLASVVREAYDKSLSEQLGGEWYSGRRPMAVKDALAFIKSQPDLLEEHLSSVQSVMKSVYDLSARAKKLEDLRYNYAAALDKRMKGEYFESLDSAGADAHAAGENFDGDCPTGVNSSSASASNSLEKLGYKRKVTGNCPFCKARVEFDPCDPSCTECGGTKKGPGKKVQKIGSSAVKSIIPKPDQRFTGRVKSLERVPSQKTTVVKGRQVERRVEIGVGGTIEYFVDKRTGERIDSV